MPLVILQGLAWHEIGRRVDRSREGRRKHENNVQARTDITVGKMSKSKGMVCKRAEMMKRRWKREGDNLRSAGFPSSHIHSKKLCSKRRGKKASKFNVNDLQPLVRVGHGEVSH